MNWKGILGSTILAVFGIGALLTITDSQSPRETSAGWGVIGASLAAGIASRFSGRHLAMTSRMRLLLAMWFGAMLAGVMSGPLSEARILECAGASAAYALLLLGPLELLRRGFHPSRS